MLDTWRRSILCAFGLFAGSAILPAQTASFIFQNQVATEANPVALTIGAFVGARESDLVVVQRASGSIATLQSRGHGQFTQPFPSLPTGQSPLAAVTGDFNRDGIPDLVVANFDSGTLSLLLGNGDGTFRSQLTLNALAPSSLAVGDFNGDGLLDLAVTRRSANIVSIFLGTGAGTFRSALDFPVGVGPASIGIADFNGDGIPDLAVANATSNDVSILLGNGDGTFRSAVSFAAGTTPSYLALGDFNHDGNIDLAAVNNTSAGTVSVLFGNGNGSLQTPVSFDVGPNPAFILAEDFNFDGNLDLAVANTGGNTVSVLMGTGTRIFLPQSEFTAGDGPAWIAVADFNADGKPDMIVANSRSNSLSMLASNIVIPNQPSITAHSIVNAASFIDGTIAPGELVTIFGSNLGPSRIATYQLSPTNVVSTALAGSRVLFNGIPAPLLYVRNDQIGAIVPYGVAGQTTVQVVVENQGVPSGVLTIPVSRSAPGLFTATASGSGQAAALNQDQSINSDSNLAVQGSVVVLYGTGGGQTSPAAVDGQLTGDVLPQIALPVSVTIGGKSAKVLYAGAAGDSVAGLIQINAQLPLGIPSGDVPVVLNVDGRTSQPGVTVAIR